MTSTTTRPCLRRWRESSRRSEHERDNMRIFVFLHVLSMFAAVAASYGTAFLTHRAAATRHVPTIRGVFSMAKVVGPFIPVFFLSGFAFAVVAIFTEGFDPFRPWLLIAYVLFA